MLFVCICLDFFFFFFFLMSLGINFILLMSTLPKYAFDYTVWLFVCFIFKIIFKSKTGIPKKVFKNKYLLSANLQYM